jgi:hypothetical protein
MNTRNIFYILLFSIIFLGCKKEQRNEPPKVVSYQIKTIIGSTTHLKYFYNENGLLSRVDGKDRDKSLTCEITYDLDRVYLSYDNRTAGEHWDIKLTVDSTTGYIQTFDDGMYIVAFLYDVARFSDGVSRLVGSYYHDGKYKGDSLCYNMIYDESVILKSCTFRGEERDFEYYLDETYDANISTNFVEVALGRFERIIAYLPYTFGPTQKYLPKTMIKTQVFYTNYRYQKDDFARVKTIYTNGAGTDYYYENE